MSFDRVGFLGCCSWTVEALDILGKVTGLMSEYALDFGELGPSASVLACARSLKMLGTGPRVGSRARATTSIKRVQSVSTPTST